MIWKLRRKVNIGLQSLLYNKYELVSERNSHLRYRHVLDFRFLQLVEQMKGENTRHIAHFYKERWYFC